MTGRTGLSGHTGQEGESGMTVTHARSETADGGPVGPASLAGPARPAGPARDAAREALARARDHLLSLQHEQGWWQGELETNVTMDAEDLLMREFLGAGDAAHTAAEARWIPLSAAR